ncbi:flagellar brake protein [Pandoraea terrigena]|uniref:Flagellar brake protein YcgR n=1 Tax=Pandoraea terrigena TaxID=2508292 RepID=A0A5E4T8J2_9BURK|nr:flagellar brake protein [Pandoraea terrigena]VVD84087.1 flagellar brake protein [Pandoraea terrigena]
METTEPQVTPAPTDNETQLHDSYRITNPLEIGGVLRHLATRGDFMTVYFANGQRQLVTRLLKVEPQARGFYFDWGGVEAENRALLASKRALFVGVPEGIQVHFPIGDAQEREFEGYPAFYAPYPETLVRLQRRDYFRVKTPILDPYPCTIKFPDDTPMRLSVFDLSLGGVGLRTKADAAAEIPKGSMLMHVEIELRDYGTVQVDLEVCAIRSVPLAKDVEYHIGCRFIALSRTAESRLQKLITQLELNRRAFARG